MKMFKKMKKGFTLVELIIVMVILGALAAIAIPKMGGSTEGAEIAKLKSDARMIIAKVNEQYSKDLTYANIATVGSIPITATDLSSGITFTVALASATCTTAGDGFTFTIANSKAPAAKDTIAFDSCTMTKIPDPS